MEIIGEPVTMRDRDGNQVQGKRVLYSIDDGKVEVKGKETGSGEPRPRRRSGRRPRSRPTPPAKATGEADGGDDMAR